MRLSIFNLLPSPDGAAGGDLYETALRRAVLADELGFHGFWVAEHHARSLSKMPSPAVFLAAASQRTRRIRLGVAVAVLPMRDPLLVAEDYALVDRLSGGRLELGVGSGVSPVEYAALGLPPQEKRSRFEESLRMVRHAWGFEGGAVQGNHRSFGDLICSVKPAQTPHPPIWQAAGSVESARAAGDAGDSVLFLTAPDMSNHRDIAEMTRSHRASFESSGNQPSALRIGAALFTVVAARDEEARSRAVAGFDRMAEARGQVPDGQATVAAAAEGERAFFGSPSSITRSLEGLAETGVTDALLWLDFGNPPEAEIEDSMRLLACAFDLAPA